ncbi:MAG: pseudouridine synthase [Gracilibacter sp. BRH_c7a]|nr:MAG: pseudouridine synthase [Gracilibacter sp. BRH_c7a]
MNGIVNILKPIGMTSTDVVRWVERRTKGSKVGHIGTLDPGAAGVLPICLGKATRLAEYYTSQKKYYRAEITLGIATDTQDGFGEEISKIVPDVSKHDFEVALNKLIGDVEQLPPMFSAVRKNGRHLYEYARKGIEVERKKRLITIYSMELVNWYEDTFPKAIFDIECSKGTYVRTICDDLGQALGCGGHMSFLLRTRSGPFKLQDSKTLEEIEECLSKGDTRILTNLGWGLELPIVNLPSSRLEAFKNGLSTSEGMIGRGDLSKQSTVQVFCNQSFIGIGIFKDGYLCPYKVIM